MAISIDFPVGRDTTCTECRGRIADDVACIVDVELRVAYPLRERRTYRHLACVLPLQYTQVRKLLRELQPELLRGVLDEVASVAPELADELAPRVPVAPIGKPLDDAAPLIEQLEAAPEDPGLLQVLADHLQERGDERGELIALQLAGAEGERMAELIAALSPPHVDHLVWGTGFVREVELYLRARSFAAVSVPLLHPSCRLLHYLEVRHSGYGPRVDVTRVTLPRALRQLEVSGGLVAGDLSQRLPYLTWLGFDTAYDLAHATVREVELHSTDRETVEACGRGLPEVRRLKIECLPMGPPPPYELGALLETSGWFARLEQLELQGISRELLDGVERRYPNVRVTTARMRGT